MAGRPRLQASTLAYARADALSGVRPLSRARHRPPRVRGVRPGPSVRVRGRSPASGRARTHSRRLAPEPSGGGPTRAPGRPLHRRGARARRDRVPAGGRRALVPGDRRGRRARSDGGAGDQARDADHHGEGLRGGGLRGGGRRAAALGSRQLRAGAGRAGARPTSPGRPAGAGPGFAGQPAGQRERPAGAGRGRRGTGPTRPSPNGSPARSSSPARWWTAWCRRPPRTIWRTSPTASGWSTGLPSAPNGTAPGSSDRSTRWHRWPTSASSSSTTWRPSSDASSGCSTARTPRWRTAACWPGTTRSPGPWRTPPSPGSCGASSPTRSRWPRSLRH